MMRVQKCAVNDHPASLEKWCLPLRRCPRSRTEVQESCIWAVPRHLCCPSFERPFLTVFWLIIPWWALSSGPKGPYCLLGCIWVQSLNCASTEPVGACLLCTSPGLMEIFHGATAPQFPMWYLPSGLSAELDHWGKKRVHLHRWGTLSNKSNILYFEALTFSRDCYIFVTKELNILPFFFVFLLFWTWFLLKNKWLNWYGNSPYQNTTQGLSIFFSSSWCVIQLHNISFSYPVECSADSGSKCREHVQSLWLCLLFLVTTLGAWAMEMRCSHSSEAVWCQEWGIEFRSH